MKHTKGPWKYVGKSIRKWSAKKKRWVKFEFTPADLYLIASAPDLLALIRIMAFSIERPKLSDLHSVIQKAEGKS